MNSPKSKKRHLPSIKKLESFRKTSLDCAQSINGKLTSILGAAEELWEHVDKKDFFATEQIEMIIRTVDKIKSSTRQIERENARITRTEQKRKKPKSKSADHKKSILLAEDDVDNRSILNIMLEKMGYKVTVAEDGQEAWNKFQKNNFKIVITDIQMPGLSGVELLKKVHKTDSKLPVLLITGYDKNEPREMAKQHDNIYFLRKPFRRNKLREVLEESLK